MKASNPILASIARDLLLIPTLESRRSDRLDFHDVPVWQIEAALKAAFDAGIQATAVNTAPHEEQRDEAVPVPSMTPLLIPKGTPLVPGKMYLRLYHGRTDPGQNMDEWGFVGPTFGPLSCYVHTYCCTFRLHSDGDTSELWLEKYDDMIRWNACFYGDMEVFIAGFDNRA